VIRPEEITVVFQGAFGNDAAQRAHQTANVRCTLAALPGASAVVSTWDDESIPVEIAHLTVVRSADPGSLPPFKRVTACGENNINRQIVSSAAGLAQVSTAYALKLRLDCRLRHDGLLRHYAMYGHNREGRERIVVSNLFSVDPRMFEQMPFHLSDWFQFGPTAALRMLWSAPWMTPDEAMHYAAHAHALHSTPFDRLYVTRFAPEQHVFRTYAQSLGYEVPQFINDTRSEVLAEHDRFVVDEVLLAEAMQSGLVFDKYAWAMRSGFQRFNCLSFADWQQLAARAAGRASTREPTCRRRAAVRARIRALVLGLGEAATLLRARPIKPVANLFFRAAAWCATPASSASPETVSTSSLEASCTDP
jgi:hypothetical protein